MHQTHACSYQKQRTSCDAGWEPKTSSHRTRYRPPFIAMSPPTAFAQQTPHITKNLLRKKNGLHIVSRFTTGGCHPRLSHTQNFPSAIAHTKKNVQNTGFYPSLSLPNPYLKKACYYSLYPLPGRLESLRGFGFIAALFRMEVVRTATNCNGEKKRFRSFSPLFRLKKV